MNRRTALLRGFASIGEGMASIMGGLFPPPRRPRSVESSLELAFRDVEESIAKAMRQVDDAIIETLGPRRSAYMPGSGHNQPGAPPADTDSDG